MKWEGIVNKEDGSVKIPSEWLYQHYYESMNVLFRIENALRVLAYIVLKNKYYDKWPDLNITSDDNAQSSIGKIAKKRMNQTQRFGYLGYIIPCPLMYMTSGELINLIFSDSYWPLFSPYFPGSKEIINNKFDEINSVRNALAHFRPIKQDDLELIKQNAYHVFPKVEKCFLNVMRCENTVPTNSKDFWYKELTKLNSDEFKFTFKQSADEKWIKVAFEYKCSIINQTNYLDHKWYRVLNLNSPEILHLFPELKAYMIFLTEYIDYPRPQEDVHKFNKLINMVFSHEVVAMNFVNIKIKIEELLRKLTEETQLLLEENLARGELLYQAEVFAKPNTYLNGISYWSFDTSRLTCIAQETDPPEYWGQQKYVNDDFITSTENYPWMPVDVSTFEITF